MRVRGLRGCRPAGADRQRGRRRIGVFPARRLQQTRNARGAGGPPQEEGWRAGGSLYSTRYIARPADSGIIVYIGYDPMKARKIPLLFPCTTLRLRAARGSRSASRTLCVSIFERSLEASLRRRDRLLRRPVEGKHTAAGAGEIVEDNFAEWRYRPAKGRCGFCGPLARHMCLPTPRTEGKDSNCG